MKPPTRIALLRDSEDIAKAIAKALPPFLSEIINEKLQERYYPKTPKPKITKKRKQRKFF